VRDALERVYAADQIRVSVHAGLSQRTGADGNPDWNPAARDFPLQVVLAPAAALDDAARQDIQGLAAGAIGFDASRGDAVTFGTIAPAATAPLPAPPASISRLAAVPAPITPLSTGSGTSDWLILAGVATLLIVILAIAILRQRAASRPLSARERARLADQIGRMFDQEDRDGVALS
jgi:hypothetical protein